MLSRVSEVYSKIQIFHIYSYEVPEDYKRCMKYTVHEDILVRFMFYIMYEITRDVTRHGLGVA